MSLQNLTRFPRLELIGAPTPLEYLPRLSDHLGREIFIKRDDTTRSSLTMCVRRRQSLRNWDCIAWRYWKIPSAPGRRTI